METETGNREHQNQRNTFREHGNTRNILLGTTPVAQARYMSSLMTFALLRNSSDLHICKGLYGENNDRFFNQ